MVYYAQKEDRILLHIGYHSIPKKILLTWGCSADPSLQKGGTLTSSFTEFLPLLQLPEIVVFQTTLRVQVLDTHILAQNSPNPKYPIIRYLDP